MKGKRENIKELVKKAKEGFPNAFAEIYDCYFSQIYRFIFLRVNNREEAEDLSQQVFVKAWESIRDFQEKGFPFSSWLYRIARNLVIDFYRTKKQTTELNENILIEDSSSEVDNRLFVSFVGKEISKAFNFLTSEQKEVIILRFVQDLSYREIAKIMDKNQPALRILQYRAINKLKNILDKGNFE
jgi:RNA polymerase sigma-70 factor (ECF subfamily)